MVISMEVLLIKTRCPKAARRRGDQTHPVEHIGDNSLANAMVPKLDETFVAKGTDEISAEFGLLLLVAL